MAYVVVVNRKGFIPLRHIVDTTPPYDEEAFKAWYYEDYQILEGDEFIYCSTRQEMLDCVEEVRRST